MALLCGGASVSVRNLSRMMYWPDGPISLPAHLLNIIYMYIISQELYKEKKVDDLKELCVQITDVTASVT
jgi:hypothetical protein